MEIEGPRRILLDFLLGYPYISGMLIGIVSVASGMLVMRMSMSRPDPLTSTLEKIRVVKDTGRFFGITFGCLIGLGIASIPDASWKLGLYLGLLVGLGVLVEIIGSKISPFFYVLELFDKYLVWSLAGWAVALTTFFHALTVSGEAALWQPSIAMIGFAGSAFGCGMFGFRCLQSIGIRARFFDL